MFALVGSNCFDLFILVGENLSSDRVVVFYIAQRQRVPRMTLSDLSGVFHLTISVATVKLDVSDSTVKSICRRGKLKRWPQRKVQCFLQQSPLISFC